MRCFVVASLAAALFLSSGVFCNAQAVKDGLTVYYSFDAINEDGEFIDGSDNKLNGLITFGFDDANGDDLDDITVDTEDKKVGAGSAWFNTDAEIKEDYIAICDPINQPDHNDGCGELMDDRPAYVPSSGFTVAAWMKVEETGLEHSVYQSRAGGGGYVHTQLNPDGNTRMTLRGDLNADTFVNFNETPPDGPYEFEEWIHYAGTYQKGEDPDEPGEWAFYFNGEEVNGGEADGPVAGIDGVDLVGDWGQGAWLGLVPDFNRQLVGHMDEFYLFNRGLSADEILTIYNDDGGNVGDPCDFDADGSLGIGDVDLLTAEVAAGTNGAAFDVTGDGSVNFDDLKAFVTGAEKLHTFMGDSNLDGEFNSGDLVGVFQAGKFETADAATWAQGDWNGDGVFGSGDLVVAFQDGGFEAGPRVAATQVPEPTSLVLVVLGTLVVFTRNRRS